MKRKKDGESSSFFSFFVLSDCFFFFFFFLIPLTPNKDQDHTKQTGHVKDRGMYPMCGFYDGMENIEI